MRGKKNLAGKIPNEVTFGMYKKLSRYSISDPHIHCEADIILTLCSSLIVSWISFCIWATELESGPSSSNTYPSSRLIRAQSIVLDQFDFELDNHRAPVEIPGTSNK